VIVVIRVQQEYKENKVYRVPQESKVQQEIRVQQVTKEFRV